jgi:hypothetical protein
MEDQEDTGDRIDIEKKGQTVNQEQLHVFPISSATILF